MKTLYILAVLGFMAETLVAKPLPPIGKRKYILDSSRPEIPATIEGFDGQEASESQPRSASVDVMKDPIPLDGTPMKPVKEWKEPERVVHKASKLTFEKVAVAGRYSVPRVSLKKERKPVEHAEQAVKQDFRKKAQESDDMLKDLNW